MSAPDSGAPGAPGHVPYAAPPAGGAVPYPAPRPAAPHPPGPPVPPGPGVRPPFAAPPQRREGGILALWLILGGFTLLLCLVGGGIGVGGALVSAFQETDREAQAVAGDYLDAIADQRYDDAYNMTCQPLRKEVSEREFTAVKRNADRITGYELGSLQALQDGRLMVPADLRLESGGTAKVGIVMAREAVEGSGQGPDAEYRFRVCGEVEGDAADPGPAPS